MSDRCTGFSLFMLCHHFSRRGRAMLSSLTRQEGCSVPLNLTAFYSRPKDGEFLLEGAAHGPNPPALILKQVSDDQIMQRAVHFSQAQETARLSHIVFCDADLWFPATFWAEYVRAVEGEPPGYWSCRVMNVPLPGADNFVDAWKTITEDRLAQASAGRRHDLYSGHVGHFQCIPRGMAKYPADPRPSVDTVDLAFSKIAIEKSVNRRLERRIGRCSVYHLDHPPSWNGTGGVEL